MPCIKYELQTGCVDEITWIYRKINEVDFLAKYDSPLTAALQLNLYTGLLRSTLEVKLNPRCERDITVIAEEY